MFFLGAFENRTDLMLISPKAVSGQSTSRRNVQVSADCGQYNLAFEKFDKFRDDLIRRLFHEPVPGIANDHTFNIRRH